MVARKREIFYTCMLLPALLGFLIFFVTPVFLNFAYSVTDWSVYKQDINFIGLRNFTELFQDKSTVSAIEHSIRYAIIITVVQNSLAIFFAVVLNNKMRTAGILKSIFFFPAMLSILVVGFLFQYIMTSLDYGLLNRILNFVGLASVNWLGDPNLALYSVLATQVWQWTGWAMVIYIANLKSIDQGLFEAARIDGASPIQIFRRITLPLLYPAVSFNVLMSLIGGLKVFDAVFAMTKGGPGYASETIMTTIIRTGFNSGRAAYACAFCVVFFIIVFIVTRILIVLFDKWGKSIA